MGYCNAVRLLPLLFLALPLAAQSPSQPQPDLGPNVLLITPQTPRAEAQAAIDRIYAVQQHNEFGPERNAILFAPGEYHLDIPVGFYTQVLGLGGKPDDVHIIGNVHADASLPNNNATCTFWRGMENLWVTPAGGTMQWAVSQATVLRRMHISGNLQLHQHGWASGGWLADSVIDGTIDSGPQQQWITRNSSFRKWTGSNWNMVFVGDTGASATTWPSPAYTTIARTPGVQEKPFLFITAKGEWRVSLPHRNFGAGPYFPGADPMAESAPLSRFYIAHPQRDNASTLNAALHAGRSILFLPGIYPLEAALHVERQGSVLLGLGYATLQADKGTEAIVTDDVGAISIAGLLIDAGPMLSPALLRVGSPGTAHMHRGTPDVLSDIFFRVGGAGPGRVGTNLEVNVPGTIVDHTWIWRADHGKEVGWDKNLSRNGLVVNADDVTVYGLFVEHHQQYQVLWRGERGRVFFYQSEIPYDPPTQAAYSSAAGVNGWASYKVADNVTQHEAWGLGIYSVFRHPDIFVSRAIEAPRTDHVRFHDMVTVCLANKGGIQHIVNDAGDPTRCSSPRIDPRLTEYPVSAPKAH